MKIILLSIFQCVLALLLTAPVHGQVPDAPCGKQVIALTHGTPVSFDYEPGQTVMLAGDAEGSTGLVGRSVVSISFESSGSVSYGVEPDSLPVQDVTPLMITGENRVKLIAVDHRDTAWLIVETPCPTAVPTATYVLIPTPTAITIAEKVIVTQTVPISHTVVTTDARDADVSMMNRDMAGEALVGRLGRILIAAAFLGLLLALQFGKPRRWALWLREQATGFDLEAVQRSLSGRWQHLRRYVSRKWWK